ncbi:MAG: hypothetical protein MI923_05085 [Phycisphaerales bacterium]|nr:hypothetical protein [Phycisphaerales bacterium]
MMTGTLDMKTMIDLRIGPDVYQDSHQMFDLIKHFICAFFEFRLSKNYGFVWFKDPKIHVIAEKGNV